MQVVAVVSRKSTKSKEDFLRVRTRRYEHIRESDSRGEPVRVCVATSRRSISGRLSTKQRRHEARRTLFQKRVFSHDGLFIVAKACIMNV